MILVKKHFEYILCGYSSFWEAVQSADLLLGAGREHACYF